MKTKYARQIRRGIEARRTRGRWVDIAHEMDSITMFFLATSWGVDWLKTANALETKAWERTGARRNRGTR